MTVIIMHYSEEILFEILLGNQFKLNINNMLNSTASRVNQVSRYQKNIHLLTPWLCGYYTIYLI